jgi:uncharacterized integral membrane protein
MRIKTIVIIIIAILLTIVLMQNTGRVNFEFLWATFVVSKLAMLSIVAIIAFALGVLAGRPNTVKRLSDDFNERDFNNRGPNTLSDEDRDYIS